jgi:hypothetical protein
VSRLLLFHELHVDEDMLERHGDRRCYEQTRDLVEAIVQVAEGRGQRMALRFRHRFAEGALRHEGPHNALVDWERRGHEIGAHAHRRHIRRTVEGLRAAGVQRLEAIVPGLIRLDRPAARRLVRACSELGLSQMSDQPQWGCFPYSGLIPWVPDDKLREPGRGEFVFVDVSVNPFSWGLLRRRGDQVEQTFGLLDRHFERLLSLLDAQIALPRPHPITYFGYPFHEHQHTSGPDSLEPLEGSLKAWDRFLERALTRAVEPSLPRDVAAAWVRHERVQLLPGRPSGTRTLRRLVDRKDLRHDLPSYLGERLLGRGRKHRPDKEHPRASDGRLRVLRRGPRVKRARMAVLVSHAGTRGGCQEQLSPWGLRPEQHPDLVFWFFDRRGSLEPGNPQHVRDLLETAARAQDEGLRLGLLSYSAGLIPALGALEELEPAWLIDTEGPADRRSLVPRSDQADEEGHLSWLDDPALDRFEPWRLLPRLRAPYHRLQARRDHQHGPCALHAKVLLDVAVAPSLNGQPWTGELPELPARPDLSALLRSLVEG